MLDDEERFNRAWNWHQDHCKPKRSRKEFDLIRKWVVDKHTVNRDNWFNRLHWEQEEKAKIRTNTSEQEKLLAEEIRLKSQNIPTLSVSEALRYLPPIAENLYRDSQSQGHDFILQRTACDA